nr:hypothetical protein [Tanacetum cinerariifolium]
DDDDEEEISKVGEQEAIESDEGDDEATKSDRETSQLPTPPTQIPSLDLQSLPAFASVFRFEERVKSLEDNFSNIPGIVNQYMHQ